MSEVTHQCVTGGMESEPTWGVAHLFPSQGQWSEEEYLALPGNRLVEFSHGILEVLCSPTMSHQLAVAHLCRALWEFIRSRALGTAIVSPLPVRLWPGEYREPDVVFLLAEHADRMGEPFWDGADLVMEVVGDDDRRRDLEIKRREYAKAGIPEYWIVDPLLGRITVLRLEGDRYAVLGEFARGERATSSKADGFALDVAEALKGR